MKKILIISLILSSQVFAQSLLTCLGREENFYAKKKYTGPNYKLNQIMIEEITSLSDLKVLPSAYKKICMKPGAYPSLVLLEELMNKSSNVFQTKNIGPIEKVTFESLKEKSGEILIQYLSLVQSMAPSPRCIEENIPGVKNLFARYRYLQDVIDADDLHGKNQEQEAIFSKLREIDSILVKCSKNK